MPKNIRYQPNCYGRPYYACITIDKVQYASGCDTEQQAIEYLEFVKTAQKPIPDIVIMPNGMLYKYGKCYVIPRVYKMPAAYVSNGFDKPTTHIIYN